MRNPPLKASNTFVVMTECSVDSKKNKKKMDKFFARFAFEVKSVNGP